jgi:hypothetical protein
MGWRSRSIELENSWGFDSRLGIFVCVEDMGRNFMILNVYGPTHERIQFWDNLLGNSFTKKENLILGGDLNFSLGAAESWGQRAHSYAQSDYFNHKLGEVGSLYISHAKLCPTWRNKRLGEDYISKRLDRFLLSTNLVESPLFFRQWVGSGGESDHHPIYLEVEGRSKKPTSPFKFNSAWLKEEEFMSLAKDIWTPLVQEEQAMVQFVRNLKNIKKAIVEWARKKKQLDEHELINIEATLQSIYD